MRGAYCAALSALLAACAGAPPAPPPHEKAPALVAASPDRENGELDSDCDRVADTVDRCPEQPEDRDGFEDQDGCPDPDNDRDRIVDACDECPNDPENWNGVEDEDGCVDHPAIKVDSKIQILPIVRFARGQSQPVPEARTVLEAVRDAMKQHPEIERVAVIGHASLDEPGGDRLSEARARKVVEALVALGVEPARLEAHGVGSRRPMAPEPAEREKNRFAEFLLVQHAGRTVQRWTGSEYRGVDPPPEPPPPPRRYRAPCASPPPAPPPAVPCRSSG